MTLSEIETILLELTARHPNLTQELLTTLLAASGWEEKTIKEALVLFSQRKDSFQQVTVPPTTKVPQAIIATPQEETSITFYQPDGTEEGKLHAFVDVPVAQEKEKRPEVIITDAPAPLIKHEVAMEPSEVAVPVIAQVTIRPSVIKVSEMIATPPVVVQPIPQIVKPAPAVVSPPITEPQSLIIHDDIPEKRSTEKQGVLPGNLPLLPFESSPHIWSFAKYKDVFHKETPHQEAIKVISVMPQEASPVNIFQKAEEMQTLPVKDIEVVIESVPLRKDDKPLVFLATIMLFAIILIVGYMYSNGRL